LFLLVKCKLIFESEVYLFLRNQLTDFVPVATIPTIYSVEAGYRCQLPQPTITTEPVTGIVAPEYFRRIVPFSQTTPIE
jgi:hypothetical protein